MRDLFLIPIVADLMWDLEPKSSTTQSAYIPAWEVFYSGTFPVETVLLHVIDSVFIEEGKKGLEFGCSIGMNTLII